MALTTDERIAQATTAYYQQADSFRLSAQELLAWYQSLSGESKVNVAKLGPYHWALLPSFKRFVLTRRGYTLAAYLAQQLTEQEFAYWLAQQEDQPSGQ